MKVRRYTSVHGGYVRGDDLSDLAKKLASNRRIVRELFRILTTSCRHVETGHNQFERKLSMEVWSSCKSDSFIEFLLDMFLE
jgi:3-methyladenine DNA glycosylase AlkD